MRVQYVIGVSGNCGCDIQTLTLALRSSVSLTHIHTKYMYSTLSREPASEVPIEFQDPNLPAV